ncbi:MAG: hypothetical protein KatS3mg115_2012 [Candidatus Poribacteria bacterium]|nr:MAG: hypothetical protein KatS3mg115_2012 [Candidatus Poribacteria bacterium]
MIAVGVNGVGGNDLRIFSGRAHPELAKEIADYLGVQLGKIHLNTFPDTETHVQIEESVRGKGYLHHPTNLPRQ